MRAADRLKGIALLASSLAGACVPYAVGTGAQPVPLHDRQHFVLASAISGGGERFGDTTRGPSHSYLSLDNEVRLGIADDADIGIRVPSLAGIVVNYKRRHSGYADPDSAAFSTMWGGGFINGGYHAHLEGTVLWSGARRGVVTTYGGARLMQAIPMHRDAADDDPTLGAFFGLMLGNRDFSVAPEIAIYYDRSVLGLRSSPWMIVPSLALRDLPLPSLIGPRFPRR